MLSSPRSAALPGRSGPLSRRRSDNGSDSDSGLDCQCCRSSSCSSHVLSTDSGPGPQRPGPGRRRLYYHDSVMTQLYRRRRPGRRRPEPRGPAGRRSRSRCPSRNFRLVTHGPGRGRRASGRSHGVLPVPQAAGAAGVTSQVAGARALAFDDPSAASLNAAAGQSP